MNAADRTPATLSLIDDTTFLNPVTLPIIPDYRGYFALLPTPKRTPAPVGTQVVIDNIPGWHNGMLLASVYGASGLITMTTTGLYLYTAGMAAATPDDEELFSPAWTPIEGLKYTVEFLVPTTDALTVNIKQDGKLLCTATMTHTGFCSGAAVDGNLGRVFSNAEMTTVGSDFKIATGVRYISMSAIS